MDPFRNMDDFFRDFSKTPEWLQMGMAPRIRMEFVWMSARPTKLMW